ncbi:VOC family protein [Streptomyces anulatus]|uniref:VOC family protein n=1 Tax=Streptomyces anulatus TaxID=1892 RepID=UPI001C25BE78|nr:VOC family protein [Streptomyces anulatus]
MIGNRRFHFTKILVSDPDAQFAFYSSVLGMAEKYRVRHGEGHDALDEIIMTSAGDGDPTLVLLHYVNRGKPTPGEAVLGFSVPDVDASTRQAEAEGGTVAQEPTDMPEFGIRVGFVLDPEGHRIEIVQPLP